MFRSVFPSCAFTSIKVWYVRFQITPRNCRKLVLSPDLAAYVLSLIGREERSKDSKNLTLNHRAHQSPLNCHPFFLLHTIFIWLSFSSRLRLFLIAAAQRSRMEKKPLEPEYRVQGLLISSIVSSDSRTLPKMSPAQHRYGWGGDLESQLAMQSRGFSLFCMFARCQTALVNFTQTLSP